MFDKNNIKNNIKNIFNFIECGEKYDEEIINNILKNNLKD